jgi:hypothetical protein
MILDRLPTSGRPAASIQNWRDGPPALGTSVARGRAHHAGVLAERLEQGASDRIDRLLAALVTLQDQLVRRGLLN